MDFDSSLDN
jgi:hypothetical protein